MHGGRHSARCARETAAEISQSESRIFSPQDNILSSGSRRNERTNEGEYRSLWREAISQSVEIISYCCYFCFHLSRLVTSVKGVPCKLSLSICWYNTRVLAEQLFSVTGLERTGNSHRRHASRLLLVYIQEVRIFRQLNRPSNHIRNEVALIMLSLIFNYFFFPLLGMVS